MELLKEENAVKTSNVAPTGVDSITINCYTDPLCCWSWASQPAWHKLKQEYHHVIQWNYIMGGMIPSWKDYNDPFNAVSRPLQMGPVWMHAAQITNTNIRYSVWHEDPPTSSYPACIAVKCAALQSPRAAELYFHAVQHALMANGKNISKTEVLSDVAETVAAQHEADFNLAIFQQHWASGRGQRAFTEDLKQTRFHNIGRFPTLTITDHTGKGIIIVGHRPYTALEQAFTQVYQKTETT